MLQGLDAILTGRVGRDRMLDNRLREWGHPSGVNSPVFFLACCLSFSVACTNQSPDQIRQNTAQETAAVKRDSKAIAEGLKDGLSNQKSVDLNRASKEELTSLPGLAPHDADRIVAERPYANPRQLVTRHVVSEEEYNQIQDRVVVNP